MRRIIIGFFVVVLALSGFYVAWPAWSARQIAAAIDAEDQAALSRKIDFGRVRERAKPLFAAEVERRLDQIKREAGPIGGAIAGQLKAGIGGKLVEGAVDSLFTPANVIEIVRRGGDFRRAIRQATNRTTGGREGPVRDVPTERDTGPAPAPSPTTATPGPRKLGIANIKGFSLTGPSSIAVGIARNAEATEPDLTAEMAFVDGDWKIVGLVPRL